VLFVLRWIADDLHAIIRGIPELLVIYLVFFGGGAALRAIASGMFGYEGYIDPPLFITGTVCIGVSAGAYSAEVIGGAVLAVPRGQMEAAVAIGNERAQRFFRVLVPQVAPLRAPRARQCLAVHAQGHLAHLGDRARRDHAPGGHRRGSDPRALHLLPGRRPPLFGITSFSNQGFTGPRSGRTRA
jgi:hypothetical protein